MGPFVIYGALMAGATLAVFEARFPWPILQGMRERCGVVPVLYAARLVCSCSFAGQKSSAMQGRAQH